MLLLNIFEKGADGIRMMGTSAKNSEIFKSEKIQ